jgi:hypothetical protein
MRRRLSTLCSIVSLLLCVAVCVMWVRSMSTWDRWVFRPSLTRHCKVDSFNEKLQFSVVPAGRANRDGTYWGWSAFGFSLSCFKLYMPQAKPQPSWERPAVVTPPPKEYALLAPHWFFVLISAILPAVYLRSCFRKRGAPGGCRTCGYDLRATPNRCPECGTVAQPADSEVT